MMMLLPAVAAVLLVAAYGGKDDDADPEKKRRKKKGKKKKVEVRKRKAEPKKAVAIDKQAEAASDKGLVDSLLTKKQIKKAAALVKKLMAGANTAAKKKKAKKAAKKLLAKKEASDAAKKEIRRRAKKRAEVKKKARKLRRDKKKGKKKVKRKKVKLTAKGAAQLLRTYLVSSKDFGSRKNPSARVKKYQAAMGGLVADGIVGSKTAARAKALGVTIPGREKKERQVVKRRQPGDETRYGDYEIMPRAWTPPRAAGELKKYLHAGGHPGLRGNPSKTVARMQRAMGGGIAIDGLYGGQTQRRAKALGVTIRSRANL